MQKGIRLGPVVAMLLIVAAGGALVVSVAARPFPASGDTQARLLFVGDLMPGRFVGRSMQEHGFYTPFEGVRALVSRADLAVGNLEGPLVPAGAFDIPTPSASQPLLTGDARTADALARAGFDLLSLANNHSLDAGPDGLSATVDALRAAQLEPVGVRTRSTSDVVFRDVAGLRIAFLARTMIAPNKASYPSEAAYAVMTLDASDAGDVAALAREIGDARSKADIVALLLHGGTEYATAPNSDQERIAEAAVAAGADIVVGSHPHVAQGMRTIQAGGRTALVAYSLGNAMFDQWEPDTRQGLALESVVDASGVREARLVPLEIDREEGVFAMSVADDASGQETLARAGKSTPGDLHWGALWSASQATPGIALAYRRDGRGAQTSIEDLGLGAPARVQLANDALSVSVEDENGWGEIWRTEPAWKVTGYSVGDVDGDHRAELVYTLVKPRLTWQRPDAGGMSIDMNGGEALPHIYVEGWRRGALNPVWHGSPRPAPVLAAVAAPIGEGGSPMLATIESDDPASEGGPGRLRLWKWSGGFGFELAGQVSGRFTRAWTDGTQIIVK